MNTVEVVVGTAGVALAGAVVEDIVALGAVVNTEGVAVDMAGPSVAVAEPLMLLASELVEVKIVVAVDPSLVGSGEATSAVVVVADIAADTALAAVASAMPEYK